MPHDQTTEIVIVAGTVHLRQASDRAHGKSRLDHMRKGPNDQTALDQRHPSGRRFRMYTRMLMRFRYSAGLLPALFINLRRSVDALTLLDSNHIGALHDMNCRTVKLWISAYRTVGFRIRWLRPDKAQAVISGSTFASFSPPETVLIND